MTPHRYLRHVFNDGMMNTSGARGPADSVIASRAREVAPQVRAGSISVGVGGGGGEGGHGGYRIEKELNSLEEGCGSLEHGVGCRGVGMVIMVVVAV